MGLGNGERVTGMPPAATGASQAGAAHDAEVADELELTARLIAVVASRTERLTHAELDAILLP